MDFSAFSLDEKQQREPDAKEVFFEELVGVIRYPQVDGKIELILWRGLKLKYRINRYDVIKFFDEKGNLVYKDVL